MESFEAFYEVTDNVQKVFTSKSQFNELKTGQLAKWIDNRPEHIGEVYLIAACDSQVAVFCLKDNAIVSALTVDNIKAYQPCTSQEFESLFLKDHKLLDQASLEMNLRSFEKAVTSATRQARGKLFAAKKNNPVVVVQPKKAPPKKENFFTIHLRDVFVGMTMGVSIVILAVQLASWSLNS
jgi:hypothetical protein